MANRATYSSGLAHPSTRYWIDLIVETLQVDTDNNRSLIFFDLRARSEYTWDLEFRGRLGYIAVNGVQIVSGYTDLGAWDGDGGKYNRRICTITKWINHDANGALNMNVTGYYNYSGILISGKWWLNPVSVTGTYKGTMIERVPTVSVSIKNQTAETVAINWKSNINIKNIQCKYGSTTKNISVSSAKSGTFTISSLTPGTGYTFKIKMTTTGNKDSVQKSLSAKTVAATKITSSADFVFASSLPIKKTNETGFKDDLYLYINGKLILTRVDVANTYTLRFNQTEVDTIYKLFGKSNTAEVKLTVVCKGTKNHTDSKTGVLLLTGNARTAHIGIAKQSKRAKVYVGVGKVARRAVVWVGVNGNPRRTI